MKLIESHKNVLKIYECPPKKEKIKQYRKENLDITEALKKIYRLELANLELLKKLKEGNKIEIGELYPIVPQNTLTTFQKLHIQFCYEQEDIIRLFDAYLNEECKEKIINVYRNIKTEKPDSSYLPLKPLKSIYVRRENTFIYYYPYLLELSHELQMLEYIEEGKISKIGQKINDDILNLYEPAILKKEIELNILEEKIKKEILIELPYHEEVLYKMLQKKAC